MSDASAGNQDAASDPQDAAEALDDELLDPGAVDDPEGIDRFGDRFGEAYGYPPDQPAGVDAVGVTAVEEGAGESFAERDRQYEPELAPSGADPAPRLGQLVDDADGRPDDESQLLAEAAGGVDGGAEQAAMHVEADPDRGAEEVDPA